jgi:hypothetical protein
MNLINIIILILNNPPLLKSLCDFNSGGGSLNIMENFAWWADTQVRPYFFNTSRTCVITFSTVKPYSSKSLSIGAEAPKLSTPMAWKFSRFR